MKKRGLLLLFFGLFFGVIAEAQSPQAFSYQAVATDNQGAELRSQSIGIKASIMQGGPSGTLVWSETHAVSTDEFGLFTISVGEGAGAGGSAASFSGINWGTGPYYLRIEMDVTGGSSYVFVGVSPLLSVPYALYANQSAQAARAGVADSAVVARQAVQSVYADSSSWTLESLRTLYADSAFHARRADTAYLSELAILAANAMVADLATNALSANSTNFASYAGVSQYADTAGTALDDDDRDSQNELQTLSISRDTIRISDGNFIAMNAVSPFNAPGATLDFPEGTDHAFFLYIFNSYTVPAGRNFYITASQSEIRLPGVGNGTGRHFTQPSLPVIPAGFAVSNCRCTGFLVNQTSQINPVVIVLQPNNQNSYQIPFGRYLVIKSGVSPSLPISYDGTVMDFYSTSVKAMVAPSGVILRNPGSEEMIITGYLKNNN